MHSALSLPSILSSSYNEKNITDTVLCFLKDWKTFIQKGLKHQNILIFETTSPIFMGISPFSQIFPQTSRTLSISTYLEEAVEILGRGDKESARNLLRQAGIELLDSPGELGEHGGVRKILRHESFTYYFLFIYFLYNILFTMDLRSYSTCF